jgi:uncharacterized protein YbaR (Trm112 family)
MPIDQELLDILACPGCKTAVKLVTEPADGKPAEKLVCQNPDCGLKYPIREGIPVMLISEAEGPQAVKDRYR